MCLHTLSRLSFSVSTLAISILFLTVYPKAVGGEILICCMGDVSSIKLLEREKWA